MALDGIFLHFLKQEIEHEALGARVEKVSQPSKEELVLSLRNRTGAYKLLLSVRSNSPRVHFTKYAPDNPQTPPMLCMLLRKTLVGAVLTGLRQAGLDRVLFLDFDASNEIGDRVHPSLCIEIMARHSNIILLDENGTVIDAVKRIDAAKSSVREILPGVPYELPPAQDKVNLLQEDARAAYERVLAQGEARLSAALLHSLQGVSPIVCRELANRAAGEDLLVSSLSLAQKSILLQELEALLKRVRGGSPEPEMVLDQEGKPVDFAFLPVGQYGSLMNVRAYPELSALLDDFYTERDRAERTKQRAQDLFRLLTNTMERITRRLNAQRAELAASEDREELRIRAELINAYQYTLEKGAPFYDVENYYDENRILRIPADPALTPARNAQKYYKEYRKAQTAQRVLTEQIAAGEQELQYIESVFDALSRSRSERELAEIREELAAGGYLKRRRSAKQKAPKALPPMEFCTDDGFSILVGRNNVQNDKLSLKMAAKNDLWLHTKNIPGSHVILVTGGQEPSGEALVQAAQLAAWFSRARESSSVPVDYTPVRMLRKPQGARPGKVIYDTYRTLSVRPSGELAQRLAQHK
ncbi:MAG: NFACT RNA binding domain-containing protein [Candidatus Fimivicinus sp.]|nr:NFACT family protein [Oscillospiraceae bacterium]MDY5591999.1 NFACT RNA binding domain-containing protein [Candidatus Fimivicinus sp.]